MSVKFIILFFRVGLATQFIYKKKKSRYWMFKVLTTYGITKELPPLLDLTDI